MLLSKIKEIKNGRVIVKDSKTKDSLKDDYAEKLFNKLWDELTSSQKEEIKRHIEYDTTKGVK